MKNFDHQVWCVNGSTGVLSRLAGFNSGDVAIEFKNSISKSHPQTNVLVVVNGSELVEASVGRAPSSK